MNFAMNAVRLTIGFSFCICINSRISIILFYYRFFFRYGFVCLFFFLCEKAQHCKTVCRNESEWNNFLLSFNYIENPVASIECEETNRKHHTRIFIDDIDIFDFRQRILQHGGTATKGMEHFRPMIRIDCCWRNMKRQIKFGIIGRLLICACVCACIYRPLLPR